MTGKCKEDKTFHSYILLYITVYRLTIMFSGIFSKFLLMKKEFSVSFQMSPKPIAVLFPLGSVSWHSQKQVSHFFFLINQVWNTLHLYSSLINSEFL